jgi:diguanylate cyclase (GGDEF)-like protein/PAS domain S-box-containing protein
LLLAAGGLTVVNNYLPGSGHLDRLVLDAVGVTAVLLGVLVLVLPWERWPASATLAIVPVGLALIGVANRYGGVSPYSYATYFVAVFTWVGLSQRPGTSTLLAPLAAAVYVAPALLEPQAPTGAVSSVTVAIPVCVLVGETVGRTLRAKRRQDAVFRLLADNSSDLISRLDPQGRFLYLSPSCRSILGIDPDELIGKSPVDLAHPDDVASLERLRRTLLEEPDVVTVVFRARQGDGTYVWLESTAHTIRDPDTDAVVEIQAAARDVTARQEAEARLRSSEERLSHQALHDPLTGLPNRALLLDRLCQALVRAERHGRQRPALLFLDLDRFKVINDSLGHATGDEVLREVARRLAAAVREGDTVSRLGGDEFVVLCDEAGTIDEAERLARRLQEALAPPVVLAEGQVSVTASIGVALAGVDQGSAEDLVRDADTAMYRAKEQGRDRYAVFDHALRAWAVRRLHVERVLRRTLDEGGLRMHYQPIIDLRQGRVAAVEALLRIDNSRPGPHDTEEFITVAEETGLIMAVGASTLEEACRQAACWQETLGTEAPHRMAVNVSARQLSQPDLAAMVAGVLARCSLQPSALSLELTEQVYIDAGVTTRRMLDELKALGVAIGIDDFGTGYCSLEYLKRFPVDFVKIDRSFVDGLGTDPGDTAIVRAVISLGQGLGLATVAEGVETPAQAAMLRQLECDYAQGYYFARPQGAATVAELFAAHPRW